VDTCGTLLIDRDGRVRYVHRGFTRLWQKYEQQVRELLKDEVATLSAVVRRSVSWLRIERGQTLRARLAADP